MKKSFILALTAWFSLALSLLAADFDSQTKYRFSCKQYAGSVLVPGVAHGQLPELYFDPQGTLTDDAWWFIRADGDGYTISNASTGQFITYTTERFPGAVKGLKLTDYKQNDDSRWTIEASGSYFLIRSVSNPTHIFNLRTDGTYLLGTYEGYGSDNELFAILSEKEGDNPGGGEPTEPFTGTQGKSDEGEYWENTGLSSPVVYTSDPANPVLYSIVNIRRKQYVRENYWTLGQAKQASERTQFYFVHSDQGTQIFSESGHLVSTYYTEEMGDISPLNLTDDVTTANLWTLGWSADYQYPGYTIEKMDNLIQTDPTQSEYTCWNDYSGSAIGLYSVDPGSTFVFASSDRRHIVHLAAQGITFDDTGDIDPGKLGFTAVIDSLRLNNKQLVFDNASGNYFSPLPVQLRDGGEWRTTLTAKPFTGYAGWNVTLAEATPDEATGEIVLHDPSARQDYTLVLSDAEGTPQDTAKLIFTWLPIVEVNVPTCNGDFYTTGSIRVTDANVEGHDSTFIAAYRYRGATAMGKSKKAYAIKLRDEAGNSVDRSFFGLRNDNNWILDAMAVDPACMRNRVSTDIWNDFSTPPYYKDREKKARTGTRGQFVEVMLNGSYHGLYCMTEKMDRKQLKLKKYVAADQSATGQEEIHGLLYKSSQWSYEVFMGHEMDEEYFSMMSPSPYKNLLGEETWCEYEFKYPDYEEEAVDWKPLWDAINFVCISTQGEFDSQLATYFDYPVLKDYYLFIELLLATDNHGKNMFYFVYDKDGAEGNRLGLAPWDLDGVLGARWDGSTSITGAEQDFDQFLWANEHGEHTIYYRLKSSSIPWDYELAERYCELRRGHWQKDALVQRVADYASLFADSRATTREQQRWPQYHSGITKAANYIKTWLGKRIDFLDEKYGYDPVLEGLNTAKAESYLKVSGGRGALGITAGKAQTVKIYSASGALVRQLHLTEGFHTVGGLQPGVYVVGGQKVLVQ